MAKKFASDEERRAYWRAWYEKNKHRADYKAKDKATKKRIRKERLDWWREYKKGFKCELCPETELCCLDLHHRDPKEKDYEVGNMVQRGMSKETILAEVEKCQVLCSNCHRKLHWKEKQEKE